MAAELTTPEELEEALLHAVRQHLLEGGEVDLSSVSLRPADLSRMLPNGVGVPALMQAGFLQASGSMLKLAPQMMAALRAPALAYAVGLITEPAAPAATCTTTCVVAPAPAPFKKRSNDAQLSACKRARSVLTMPLVSGLPHGVPLVVSWTIEQVRARAQRVWRSTFRQGEVLTKAV